MAQRGRPSVTKRQKELSRQEKRVEKAERRAQRKHESLTTTSTNLEPPANADNDVPTSS